MKKTLAIALAFASTASVAMAQQTVEPMTLPLVEHPTVAAPGPTTSSSVAATGDYVWYSRVFVRFGQDGDTNRRDLTVPLGLGNPVQVEMRGFGQILPAPASLYLIYNGSIYKPGGTTVHDNLDEAFETDQDYINQFQNATRYTIDGFDFPFFKNPNMGPTQNPGLITIYKTKANLRSSTFRQNGFGAGRSSLTKLREIELGTDALDTTINADATRFQVTHFLFDGSSGANSEPLALAADESAIVLYTNEFSPVVEQPVETDDTREFQRAVADEEYATGSFVEDPNNPGTFLDQRADPLDSAKCFAVVMYRAPGTTKDSIYSAWKALVFGSGTTRRSAIMNLAITFFGTVELNNGSVKYHFGKDAESQGIGAATPNPAREQAVVPFSLMHTSNVRMDLFDASGTFVRTLVNERYVKGNYSVDVATDGLANGVYLVRLTAGDNAYSSKIVVSR